MGKLKDLNIKAISFVAAFSMLTGVFATACGKKETTEKEETTTAVSESEDTEESATDESVTETEAETETQHVSPMVSVTSELGYQLEVGATLDKNTNKTYKASLKDLGVEDGDKVTSFTFIFSSDSTMDSYQGGAGISVKSDCPSATDDSWYQSEDFTYNLNSKYAEIKWDVPTDIQDYVDASGQVLIGFWWSSASTVKLDYIICNTIRTKELPVDATASAQPNLTLDYSSDSSKTGKVNLSDMLKEGDVPQAVTYTFSANGSLGKFTGGFGISTTDSSSGNYYQSMDVANITDSSSLSLTWIIPDDVKEKVDISGTVDLGYWYSAQNTITLTDVSVQYSSDNPPAQSDSANNNAANNNTPSADNTSADAGKTAKDIVSDIKIGWNLGNTFDSDDSNLSKSSSVDETYWGNPKTTKEMIDSVKNAGFNAIRIPVTWFNHVDADFNINSDWMARVKEVVDYAYNDNMYVILNLHHEEDSWLDVQSISANDKLKKLWEQISAEFKDYDNHLIFEGMNEPRTKNSANEWNGGTQAERDNINVYWQTFVDTVRASGGNNASRALIVSTYAQSVVADAVNGLKVPSDSNIIVSIHSYSPWSMAGDANSNVSTFGSDQDKKDLDSIFDLLKTTFVDKGIPVIIGEFGAIDKNNESDRAALYEYYVSAAKQRGIKCFYWDNGLFAADSKTDSYSIFDREKLSWNQTLLAALMKGAN